MINRAMDEATNEIKLIRQYSRRSGINVLSETRDKVDRSYTSKYVCRGYTGSFTLPDGNLAADIEIIKRKFLGEDVARYLRDDFPPK